MPRQRIYGFVCSHRHAVCQHGEWRGFKIEYNQHGDDGQLGRMNADINQDQKIAHRTWNSNKKEKPSIARPPSSPCARDARVEPSCTSALMRRTKEKVKCVSAKKDNRWTITLSRALCCFAATAAASAAAASCQAAATGLCMFVCLSLWWPVFGLFY